MKDFKIYYEIDALPEDVWNAFVNPVAIQLWSGYLPVMNLEPGSEFEMWEGDICGQIVSFVMGKELVQKWYFGDQEEDSIATIKIHPDKTDQTKVEVKHTNIPDEDYDDIVEGWKEYYLKSIADFVEE